MKKETYIEILNLCTSKDEKGNLSWLCSPFNCSGRTMASNAHILVAVPSVGDYPYTPSKKMQSAYPFEKTMRVPIALENFKTELAKYPTEPVFDRVDCDACDGEGSVEWTCELKGREYKDDHDCPVCDGDGYFRYKTGKVEIDEDEYFRLGVSVFRIAVISKLVRIAELAGADEVVLVSQAELSESVFEIGEIEVLIMPVGCSREEVIGTINIE